MKTVPLLPKQGASILRTSKHIYSEAVHVLYSKRTFNFTDTCLQQFVTECKTRTRYVQRIHLSYGTTVSLGSTLVTLTDVPRLRQLQIYTSLCACRNVHKPSMKTLLAGVKRFVRLGSTREDIQHRFNALEFTVPVTCHGLLGLHPEVSAEMRDQWVSTIKTEAAEALTKVREIKRLGVVFV